MNSAEEMMDVIASAERVMTICTNVMLTTSKPFTRKANYYFDCNNLHCCNSLTPPSNVKAWVTMIPFDDSITVTSNTQNFTCTLRYEYAFVTDTQGFPIVFYNQSKTFSGIHH